MFLVLFRADRFRVSGHFLVFPICIPFIVSFRYFVFYGIPLLRFYRIPVHTKSRLQTFFPDYPSDKQNCPTPGSTLLSPQSSQDVLSLLFPVLHLLNLFVLLPLGLLPVRFVTQLPRQKLNGGNGRLYFINLVSIRLTWSSLYNYDEECDIPYLQFLSLLIVSLCSTRFRYVWCDVPSRQFSFRCTLRSSNLFDSTPGERRVNRSCHLSFKFCVTRSSEDESKQGVDTIQGEVVSLTPFFRLSSSFFLFVDPSRVLVYWTGANEFLQAILKVHISQLDGVVVVV